jgi:hypothetical protein
MALIYGDLGTMEFDRIEAATAKAEPVGHCCSARATAASQSCEYATASKPALSSSASTSWVTARSSASIFPGAGQVPQETECPPVFQSRLASQWSLKMLDEAWRRLERRAKLWGASW